LFYDVEEHGCLVLVTGTDMAKQVAHAAFQHDAATSRSDASFTRCVVLKIQLPYWCCSLAKESGIQWSAKVRITRGQQRRKILSASARAEFTFSLVMLSLLCWF
jgi:hypothetical protein